MKKSFRRGWLRLDNASKIFLAARNARDTKVFRMTAELFEPVEPTLLQQALDLTYDQHPLYHSVLRRGIFWYYLEESRLRPVVEEEKESPCAGLYHFERKNLLFRLLYYGKRIHLEIFHGLSDGTGGLWFFEDLLQSYLLLRHPEISFTPVSSERRQRLREQQMEDSFSRYFGRSRSRYRPEGLALRDAENEAAANMPMLEETATTAKKAKVKGPKERIFRLRGTWTPDRRINIIEAIFPLRETLNLAREQGVSLTVLLTAMMALSIYDEMPEHRKGESITVSVPINLRPLYRSETARNFFAALTLAVNPGRDGADLSDLCRQLADQLDHQSHREALEKRLEKLMRYEEHPLLRIIVRPLKDLILGWISNAKGRKISFYISNLGRVRLHPALDAHLGPFSLAVAVMRPQFCSISHGEDLTVTLLSPFMERNWQNRFLDKMEELGIRARVSFNELPREEKEEKLNPLEHGKRRREKRGHVEPKQAESGHVEARHEEKTAFPYVPLKTHPHMALRILAFLSLAAIALSFLVSWVWPSELHWPLMVLAAVANIWLLATVMIRKRRNIAKSLVYLISLLSAISLFWDWDLGWRGWSLDYAIPLICISALIAIFVSVQFVRLESGDYILYLILAAILGFLPFLFIILNLVTTPYPSFVSAVLALLLFLAVLIFRGAEVMDELKRRMHI